MFQVDLLQRILQLHQDHQLPSPSTTLRACSQRGISCPRRFSCRQRSRISFVSSSTFRRSMCGRTAPEEVRTNAHRKQEQRHTAQTGAKVRGRRRERWIGATPNTRYPRTDVLRSLTEQIPLCTACLRVFNCVCELAALGDVPDSAELPIG